MSDHSFSPQPCSSSLVALCLRLYALSLSGTWTCSWRRLNPNLLKLMSTYQSNRGWWISIFLLSRTWNTSAVKMSFVTFKPILCQRNVSWKTDTKSFGLPKDNEIVLRLCFAVRRIASLPVVLCVCTVTFLAPLGLLINPLFLPIIYTFCIVIAYLLYSNAHSYRSLVFIFHFLAVCWVL